MNETMDLNLTEYKTLQSLLRRLFKGHDIDFLSNYQEAQDAVVFLLDAVIPAIQIALEKDEA